MNHLSNAVRMALPSYHDAPRVLRARSWLDGLLPDGIAIAELVGEAAPPRPMAAELPLVERAGRSRVRDFSAGRSCARRALEQFGITQMPIGMHGDRRPQWPPLLTGSITHTDGYSAAAVGIQQDFCAVGIDAERICGMSAEVRNQVMAPAEMAWQASLPAAQQAQAATLVFSAKEAFYKCQYEVTQQWLEFQDIALVLVGGNLDRGSFAVRPVGNVMLFERGVGPAIVRFSVAGDLVLAAMVVATRRPSSGAASIHAATQA